MLNTISVYAIGGGSYIQLTVMRLYTPGYGHLLVLGCILFPMSFFSVQRLVHFLLEGSAVARCPEHKGGASKKEEEAEKACGRCQWTQRRISSEIAMRLVGLAQAVYSSVVSFMIILETQHDVLYSKSSLLPPFIHAMIPYFVYDCYAMYVTSALEEREKHPSLLKQFTGFVKKKLPFIVHHVLLCVLGYPIVVNPELLNNLGEFFIGCFCFGELSNIFLNISVSLKTLNMHRNSFFLVNGAVLCVSFIFSRILIIPYMYLQYFNQEETDWTQSLRRIPIYCHCGMTLIITFQSLWLYMLVVAACKIVKTKKTR